MRVIEETELYNLSVAESRFSSSTTDIILFPLSLWVMVVI